MLGRCWVLIRFRNDGLEHTGGTLSSFAVHPYLAFHSTWHSRIIIDEENPNKNPFQPLQAQKATMRIKEKQTRRQVWHEDHRSLETGFLVTKSLPAPRGGIPSSEDAEWPGSQGHLLGPQEGTSWRRKLPGITWKLCSVSAPQGQLTAWKHVQHIFKEQKHSTRDTALDFHVKHKKVWVKIQHCSTSLSNH